MDLKLPAHMVEKIMAKRAAVSHKSDIPEVNHVIETAVDKFLAKARENQARLDSLPKHEVLAKEAPWVSVETTGKAESTEAFVNEPEVIDEADAGVSGATEIDFDAEDGGNYGREYRDEITESNRHIVLGIPERSEARLVPTGFELDESQKRAIDNLLNEQYGCLIGAAGTGKTTVTKFLVDKLIYDPESTFKARKVAGHLNIAFAAFTGMAVQVIKENLPEWLHPCCMTIHSLLEFMPQEQFNEKTGKTTMPFIPTRNAERPLDYDLLIIDEASMLGMDLWNQLRIACLDGTRVIFIGDLNQLPPIIGESVFAYALSQWTVSELTHIHRQKGPGASKIIDIAHMILNGRPATEIVNALDKMKGNPHWRVAGAVVDSKAKKAAGTILATVNVLRNMVHENGSPVYDPYRDRIMTAGNGYDEMRESSLVQQYPINEALALAIQPSTEEHPRYLIDAGKGGTKHFSVGNRVMATKNESPAKKDRVTNGLTGVITRIVENAQYTGNPHKFGSEIAIAKYQRTQFALMSGEDSADALEARAALEADSEVYNLESIADELSNRLAMASSDEEIDQASGEKWSSHTVYVKFVNGAEREYWSKTQMESLQLAYASTVAKCQGSQFPTAIIIVHDAVKEQLCREWLYTAVTRAQSHVILFYTDYALRICLNRQKIFGSTLQEKIERYRVWMTEGIGGPNGGLMRKSVVLEVGPD